jgi:hypothetical protein
MTNYQKLTLTIVLVFVLALIAGGFYLITCDSSQEELRIGRDKDCPLGSWVMSDPDKKDEEPARFYDDLVHSVKYKLDANTALYDCKRNHECLVQASMNMMAEEFDTPQTEVELRERVSKAGECANPQTIVLFEALTRKYR